MGIAKRYAVYNDGVQLDICGPTEADKRYGNNFCKSSDVDKLEQLLTEAVELIIKDCERFEFSGHDPSLNAKRFLSKPEIKAIQENK